MSDDPYLRLSGGRCEPSRIGEGEWAWSSAATATRPRRGNQAPAPTFYKARHRRTFSASAAGAPPAGRCPSLRAGGSGTSISMEFVTGRLDFASGRARMMPVGWGRRSLSWSPRRGSSRPDGLTIATSSRRSSCSPERPGETRRLGTAGRRPGSCHRGRDGSRHARLHVARAIRRRGHVDHRADISLGSLSTRCSLGSLLRGDSFFQVLNRLRRAVCLPRPCSLSPGSWPMRPWATAVSRSANWSMPCGEQSLG